MVLRQPVYRDFDKNILPKIDALAAEQNRTRSDVIRDILYARFGYEPEPRSPEQVSEDHAAERQKGKSVQYRCIVVRVDKEYRWMFFEFILAQPGRLDRNYRRYLNQTLYHYFDMATPSISPLKIPLNPSFNLNVLKCLQHQSRGSFVMVQFDG